jgi:hypothetical protein
MAESAATLVALTRKAECSPHRTRFPRRNRLNWVWWFKYLVLQNLSKWSPAGLVWFGLGWFGWFRCFVLPVLLLCDVNVNRRWGNTLVMPINGGYNQSPSATEPW